MSEVSGKVFITFLELLRDRGHNEDEFLTQLEAKYPNDRALRGSSIRTAKRLPWDSFATFLDEVDLELGGTGWENQFFAMSRRQQSTWIPYINTLMGLLTSPSQLYWVLTSVVGPRAFHDIIDATFQVLPDRRFRTSMMLRDHRKSCETFFRVAIYGMKTAPSFLGLEDAVVEAEVGPRGGIFLITPPRSASLFSRFRRWFRKSFYAKDIVNELARQDSVYRENYARLNQSESELRRTRESIETRVHDRTRELEEANALLQRRLEDILEKERENRQLYERLIHLQKIDAIGTLATGMAHEINNVLNGVQLSIELAQRRVGPDHLAHGDIEIAKKFAFRGRDIMTQILAFSRKMQAQREVVDLREVLGETSKMISSILPKGIELHLDVTSVGDHPVFVWADFTQLQQVLLNLLGNAAQSMPSGGRLRLTLALLERGEIREAIISVRDSGTGIAPEIREKIFEPFFSTKAMGQGTGMGLSVVSAIVEAHAGRIELESEIARGSTFRVILPLTINSAHDLDSAIPAGGNERLLVVEDETELLALMKDTLEAFGYRVRAIRDPLAAVKIFASDPQGFDLIVTDFSMPGITGLELAEQLKSIRADIPIVFCTAFGDVKSIVDAEGKAINAIVAKPFDGVRLNDSIREILKPSF